MRKHSILLLLAWAGLSFQVCRAQEDRFFMPVEIRTAYENGTRSYDGNPGENYWQNTVDYKINVRIVPEDKMIEGHEIVVYNNNSPDELRSLVLRLYGDAYKKGNARYSAIDERDVDEGVDLTAVSIDGASWDLDNRRRSWRNGTNITFYLMEPMKPGSDVSLEITWNQKIHEYSTIRTGAYDSTSFLIAYWYPQLSVYDDVFGWDRMDYNFRTEFYNNLGNYDVSITVPQEFMVWATGMLDNSGKVLPKKILKRYDEAHSSQETVHIVGREDLEKGLKTKNNTWHYTANEVSDFAFGTSDHYLWDAAIQPVDGRQVFVSSVFPMDTTRDYSNHVAIQQKTMKHFSEDSPGIPYPYDAFTTFMTMRRSGGMEYPMMANNGGPGRGVTIHEMMHTYFPMYVRINERRWAWMDEGWATYNTSIVEKRYFDDDFEMADVFSDLGSAGSTLGTFVDLPMITSSEFMTGENYRDASYSTPATIYGILQQYLGDELFYRCWREYIRRWEKKSPTPYDFFYTFENVSGQDLSWIWKPWFFEFGAPDIAVISLDDGNLVVEDHGNKPVPVLVRVQYKNGESRIIDQSAGVWKNGNRETGIAIPDAADIRRISVNREIADGNIVDNFFPALQSIYAEYNVPDDLTGQYDIGSYFGIVNISREDGLLHIMSAGGRLKDILYPKDDLYFTTLDNSYDIKFVQDDAGQCTGLEFTWRRYTLKGKKF